MSNLIKQLVKEFFNDITSLGGSFLYALFALIFLLSNQVIVFYKLFIGFVLVYIICGTVKLFYFKKRPNNQILFKGIIGKIYSGSFPSIHSARAFLLASILSDYFVNFRLTLFLFSLAAIVSYSRVYVKKHRYVDIVFGCLIGIFVWQIMTFL